MKYFQLIVVIINIISINSLSKMKLKLPDTQNEHKVATRRGCTENVQKRRVSDAKATSKIRNAIIFFYVGTRRVTVLRPFFVSCVRFQKCALLALLLFVTLLGMNTCSIWRQKKPKQFRLILSYFCSTSNKK